MGFKELSYWLRGGIIGLVVGVLYIISFILFNLLSNGIPGVVMRVPFVFLYVFGGLWCNIFSTCMGMIGGGVCSCKYVFLAVIVFLAITFLIGAIVGLIIGNKKKALLRRSN